jgi:hypothetical protein
MPVEIIEAPTPPAPPAPTTELHVNPETVDHGPQLDQPRPGSARARMIDALRGKAKDPADVAPAAKPAATPAAKPDAKPAAARPAEAKPAGEKPVEAAVPAKPGDKPAEIPASPDDKKKVNPWKLVDQYKGQVGKLEEEITKLRTSALPEKERTEFVSRAEKAEQRAKALEDHMRFVDFSQTEEFQKKYQEPYEKAWTKHMKELGQIKVAIGEDQSAPLQANHLLSLVNLPLEEAQELAEQMNPRFANHLMSARKEIRDLFDTQAEALADAKKNGSERVKQAIEQQTKMSGEIQKFVTESWTSANDAIVRDEKYGLYFTPVEGDENVNQRLAKGFELVDRAFSENPNDPRLTPEERRSVVKRHAAVRNRAAAFGRLVYDLGKAREEKAELIEELKKYRGSTPPSGGSPKPTGETVSKGKASDEVFAALRAKAR